MTDTDAIEETADFRPKFSSEGLIAVAVTEAATRQLLMLAWMNREALDRTLASGDAWYWSRSRQAFWRKGETSGHIQKVIEIRTDCDQDALELVVEQTGPACHTERKSCFYRLVRTDGGGAKLVFAADA